MNPDNVSSGQPTDTTSGTGPDNSPAQRPESGRLAPPASDESTYLTEQAALARDAIRKTMADIKVKLAAGMNVTDVTREHPWLTAAAAGVAGFTVAAILTPSKTDQALKRLAEIERAVNPPPTTVHLDSEGHIYGDKPSLRTVFLREVVNLLKPILLSLVTAGVAGHAATETSQEVAKAASQEPLPTGQTGDTRTSG